MSVGTQCKFVGGEYKYHKKLFYSPAEKLV